MNRHLHSPFVRRVLAERGLSPADVPATGPGGRITRRDVLSHLTTAGTANPAGAQRVVAPSAPAASHGQPWMLGVEVDYRLVERARAAALPDWQRNNDANLTHLPFVLRAVVDALAAHTPLAAAVANAAEPRGSASIHLAVARPGKGMGTGVLRDAQDLRLPAIARHLDSLAAEPGNEPGGEGPALMIVDAASLGVLIAGAAAVRPHVAALTVGPIAPKPVAVPVPEGGHGLAVRPVGSLVLTVDPEMIESRRAASVLNAIKTTLETRDWMAEL